MGVGAKENLKIGTGIYTMSEIAKILRLPYNKVYRWMKDYWKKYFGSLYDEKYSWVIDGSRVFNFHGFIEFYIMMQLAEAGVRPQQILKAHAELCEIYQFEFPFALKEVLEKIHTDGRKIYIKTDQTIISLDGTRQFNLDFIEMFFKNLEFNEEAVANRFWPLGKDKSILMDPKRKFGHPLIGSNNIYPETIYEHYLAGDPVPYLAHIFDLSEKEVWDAIQYCDAA